MNNLVALGDVATLVTDKYLPNTKNSDTRCINLENFIEGTGRLNGYSDASENLSIKIAFKAGDILFGKLRPYLKKYAKPDFDGVCTTEVLAFRASNKINADYLFQIVSSDSFITHNVSAVFGTKMPRTDWNIARAYKFFTPNLNEQQKIAQILASLDEQIELTEKLIEKKKEIFSGVENDLLSKDLNKQFLLSNLGVTYGGLNGKSKEDFGAGSNFITYMQVFGNNTLDSSKLGKVVVGSNEFQNKVKYGDILFTISSETPHELAMASVFLSKSIEPYLNSFCFGFRLGNFDDLVPEFSAHYFRSQIFRKKVLPLAQGSTRYNTSKSALMALQIEVPSIKKQHEIAEILNSSKDEIEVESSLLNKLKLQKQGLMQDLLTGQVRVS